MDFSALLFCLFFLVVGVMTIGAVKRVYLAKPMRFDSQRLRQQHALMEARRVRREQSRNWLKLDDEDFAANASFSDSHDANGLTLEVGGSKHTNAPDAFNVTRVDEAFDRFLRGRL